MYQSDGVDLRSMPLLCDMIYSGEEVSWALRACLEPVLLAA